MDICPQVHLSSQELREQFDPSGKLEQYLTLLEDENQRVNLVSRETSRVHLLSLAVESLVPLALLEETSFARYLDIGSGGGFPAIPLILSGRLTMARRPVLVERIGKKAAALGRITRGLGLKIDVVTADLPQARLSEKFDLITLRYVKLTTSLLKDAVKLLNPSGLLIYYSQPEFEPDRSLVHMKVIPYLLDNQEPVRRIRRISIFHRS